MGTSQRVSRGFHRLGLFLAAVPPLLVASFCLFVAVRAAFFGGLASVSLSQVITTLLMAFAVSLAVYGLVRAIGWVVGGFTAS